MSTLDLTPDELLSTTRAVRKRLDLTRPVPLALVRECLELAVQAPSGSNAQGWHFVVVTDAEKRRRIAELYRKAFELYRGSDASAHRLSELAQQGAPADLRQMERVVESAEYLAQHLERVPVFLIPCVTGRTDSASGPLANLAQASVYGSILPAVWSFMLAARARGLGTAWTTLHLMHERESADLLGIPYEQVMQTALIPVAFTRGSEFRPARRKPLEGILHVDAW
jgi:nitroreductase